MELMNNDAVETTKDKLLKIHEMVEEALTKMQHLAGTLQEDDNLHDFEREEKLNYDIRSIPAVQIMSISRDGLLACNRTNTEEQVLVHSDAEHVMQYDKDPFEEDVVDGSSGDERITRGAEDENDRKSISTSSSLFNAPHRAWEVDLFLKDAELSVEKRMESHDDGKLIDEWIWDLKSQRLKLTAAQQETALEGRRGIEAVRKVQSSLVDIEAAFSQLQKREPMTLDALAAVREELKVLQEAYRSCAIQKHALSLQLSNEREIRAQENKTLNDAVDSLIVRHKAEVSSLRLDIVRMKNSNERTVTALKNDNKVLNESRIPREEFQQIEKQNKTLRFAAEEAKKDSLVSAKALSAERQSRIEEMQRSDKNELRAQENIELWKTRCRQIDSSLSTVMTAYELANLEWPLDEHFRISDSSKDSRVVVALPPTPAMIAIAAEKQSAQQHLFELERELGELRVENERLHANYAASILQNDEDRLKIDDLKADMKKMAVEKENIQKKTKSALAIASAKAKSAPQQPLPAVVLTCSVESQTEHIELQGNELKEFQNNQRLQSVAGLMLKQLESRSDVNKLLQQSLEDAASGFDKSLIEGENVQHEMLQVPTITVIITNDESNSIEQFLGKMQNALIGLVHQNTQLAKTAAGERSVLLKRLQQALSSNDNLRREIDYLKCMSSNIFCENTEDDPTLGPLMHQHSVSIQTESEFEQKLEVQSQSLTEVGDSKGSNNHKIRLGKPIIPSRKAIMSKDMINLRSAIMAWMASTASKTFFAWKNVAWFGACVQSPQIDGMTEIVEIQKCGICFAKQLSGAVADFQSICKKWTSTLHVVADMISKEKTVKDLGDQFFSKRSQMQSMMNLSHNVTSLQYQNDFQTLQEHLMDDHKEILLSARRSEELVNDLQNELVCLKNQNNEMLEDSNGMSKLVEELKKKLDDEETKQLEWCAHVEATAGVWAHQVAKLVEQGRSLFDQNDAFRKLLIDSMGQVKSPLPQLIPFEHLSINTGASNLCCCSGCKNIKKRFEMVRSAALNVSAKFVSKKQAVFKGADAFLKGKSIKDEGNSDNVSRKLTTSPKKHDEVLEEHDADHIVHTLHSNGAQRTLLRVLKYHVKLANLESEYAKLQGKVDELQLLNDYLRTKLQNQDDKNIDRPGTAGAFNPKSANQSMPNSRETTPRTPKSPSNATPMNQRFPGESLVIDATSATLNPQTASLNSVEIRRAKLVSEQVNQGVPRLIKSAGNKILHLDGPSSIQTQNLDFMLDAAHRTIDAMHNEIMQLREQTQVNDKQSVELMIDRAVKLSNLRMMTQVEQVTAQHSELKKELKEKDRQFLLEKQKATADFEAHQLLLSQQLSSARIEMSRRAAKTIELRQNFQVEIAKSRSMEAAMKSAQRLNEEDRKKIQHLTEEIFQMQKLSADTSEQALNAMMTSRHDVISDLGTNHDVSISEQERELWGQLLASEHVADAAVALFHDLVKLHTEVHGNTSSMKVTAAGALTKAKILGVDLPFLKKGPWLTESNVDFDNSHTHSTEKDDVYSRKKPQVPMEPIHRTDNAMALLKLVDSDFEDMQLVKSALKRNQLRPFVEPKRNSPRNSARVLKPSKSSNDQSPKPHPPLVYLRDTPGSRTS